MLLLLPFYFRAIALLAIDVMRRVGGKCEMPVVVEVEGGAPGFVVLAGCTCTCTGVQGVQRYFSYK
jgi:hypothetical protein